MTVDETQLPRPTSVEFPDALKSADERQDVLRSVLVVPASVVTDVVKDVVTDVATEVENWVAVGVETQDMARRDQRCRSHRASEGSGESGGIKARLKRGVRIGFAEL